MSKPQHNFCLAVIRKKEAIGFVLQKIVLVYTPSMPQGNDERRKWCKDRKQLFFIARAISLAEGKRVFLRSYKNQPESLVLWGLVPISSYHQNLSKVILARCGAQPNSAIPIDGDFIAHVSGAARWFKGVCDELHKLEGGRYLITQGNQNEVPLWVL